MHQNVENPLFQNNKLMLDATDMQEAFLFLNKTAHSLKDSVNNFYLNHH